MFVGREAELEAIESIVRDAVRGHRTAALLIRGDPGIGKSRLLDEARTRLSRVTALTVTGYAAEQTVPLAAASELLARLGASPTGASLRDLLRGPTGPASAPLEPFRLFEGTLRSIEAAGPAVVFVDDVQWLDDHTVALLHFILRGVRARGGTLAVVAAGRPGGASARFGTRLTNLVPEAVEITLDPLRRDAASALVRTLREGANDTTLRQLVDRAAGSPLWLNVLAGHDGADPADAIEARIQVASDDEGAVLAALAIAGRPVATTSLRRVVGLGADRLAAAIDGLVAMGLVVERAGAASPAHDLIRGAAVASMPADERRRLHASWATELEREATDDVTTLGLALQHRRAAGNRPVDLALRIARSSNRRLLGKDGLQLLAKIAREPALDHGQPDVSFELQAAVARLAGELNDHGAAYEGWSSLADRQPPEPLRSHACVDAAWAAYRLKRADDVRRWLAIARDGAPLQIDLELRLRVADALTTIMLEHRLSDGHAVVDQALTALERGLEGAGGLDLAPVDLRRAAIDVYRAAALVALQHDAPVSMLVHARRMAATAEATDEEAWLDAHVTMSIAERLLGRYEAAVHLAAHAREIARERILPSAEIDAAAWLAVGLHDLGRLGEAQAVADDVVALIRRAGDFGTFTRVRSRAIPHEIGRLRGHDPEATRDLLAAASAETDPHPRLSYHQSVFQWLARLGTEPAAIVLEQVELGRRSAEEAGCPRCAAELELTAAEALARIGAVDEARATLAAWDEIRPDPNPTDQFARRWTAALLERGQERLATLEQLIGEADRSGRRLDGVWLRIDLARAHADSRDLAVQAWTDAAREAAAVGATTLQRVVEQELRGLGVRTWRRGRPAADDPPAPGQETIAALSPREREIATLVAAGATNPEIAARLYLSRKTVEHHVSNVLAKLGARNRAEVAGLVGLPRNGGVAR